MSSLEHLDHRILYLLDKDPEERVAYILADKFIPYPHADYLIREATDVMEQQPSPRYKCLLIYAAPGRGKTMILGECQRRLEVISGANASRSSCSRVPFIRISLPEMKEFSILDARILDALGIPYSLSDKPASLHEQSCSGLKNAGTRILCLDELHNLLSHPRGIENCMVALRDFANLPICLLCAGTMAARNCIAADEQMKVRFRWHRLHVWEISNETRDFLATLESRLPLRNPSNLSGPKLMPLLIKLSRGHLATMVTGVREAARDAVRSGKESVDETGLKTAVERILEERFQPA